MITKSRLLSLVAIPFFIAACNTFRDSSDGDLPRNPSIHILTESHSAIPDSGSYAWGPHYYRLKSKLDIDLNKVDQRLRSTIESELSQRGYHLVEKDPELIVGFAAAVGADLDETLLNEAYGEKFEFPYSTGKPDESRLYHKGSLIIDVLDGKSNKLLWRGTIVADINANVTEEQKDKRAKFAVKTLLSHFPKPRT